MKIMKKGLSTLVEASISSSMTTLAKKYIKREKVVKKRREGIEDINTKSQ